MTSVSHEPRPILRGRPQWLSLFEISEMWASLAIVVMWLAVLFDGIYGGDIVSNGGGTGGSTVPSVVVVGLFAFLGTIGVAKYGFAHDKRRDG